MNRAPTSGRPAAAPASTFANNLPPLTTCHHASMPTRAVGASTCQLVNGPASADSSDPPSLCASGPLICLLPPMSTDQLVNRPANAASVPLWIFAAALPATWLLNLWLLLTHDPLSRAIQLGADVAKEQALGAIPQEWMGWLAQPVIQMINQYVGPYALAGEAFMTTWAILLTLALPAAFLLLGFIIVHGVLLLGGAPGGWKGTARAFLVNHACADLATLAWAGLILTILNTRYSILFLAGLLLSGLLLIHLIAHSWLLISLARVHSLGALRIIFLGLPALFFGLAVSSLVTTALWTWLTAGLALAALR